MKSIALLFAAVILIVSCKEEQEISSINPENWVKREIEINPLDSLEHGMSYLSIYSQIYSMSEHRRKNLTAMASIRNTSTTDTIYLLKGEYFDTHGVLMRSYFDHSIFLAPMETVEIVIDERDAAGGTGSNFLFEWKIPVNSSEPMFEGIMISTQDRQGISFTTHGKRIK